MSTDPTIVAAAVTTVIVSLTGAVVTVIGAMSGARDRRNLLDKVNDAAQKAEIVAQHAAVIADKAVATDNKLDSIKTTTEDSAKKVDGNLISVHEELSKQSDHNDALQETIKTLTDILKSQGGGSK